ncbi:MAG: hypothetical protein ACXWKT_20770 [Caulobacteraceae bacterium]
MDKPSQRRALALAAALAVVPAAASAHGVAGARFFPATLTIDDPAVADELSAPTVSYLEGDAAETEVSAEYSKRLTRNFGLSVEAAWTRLKETGPPAASGFRNLETTAKWQVLTDEAHEAIVSLGASVEGSATGASGVGAERHTTLTPTVWFGKGFGDLAEPMAWARPFAVTGSLGYAVPTRRRDPGAALDNPRVLEWGLSLQYSLPYLQSQVRDVGLSGPLNGLIPIVEARLETPVSPGGVITGTISPGLIWAGRHWQLGAEALIPVNAASGHGVGGIVQLHLYLDDILPHSLGRPLW